MDGIAPCGRVIRMGNAECDECGEPLTLYAERACLDFGLREVLCVHCRERKHPELPAWTPAFAIEQRAREVDATVREEEAVRAEIRALRKRLGSILERRRALLHGPMTKVASSNGYDVWVSEPIAGAPKFDMGPKIDDPLKWGGAVEDERARAFRIAMAHAADLRTASAGARSMGLSVEYASMADAVELVAGRIRGDGAEHGTVTAVKGADGTSGEAGTTRTETGERVR